MGQVIQMEAEPERCGGSRQRFKRHNADECSGCDHNRLTFHDDKRVECRDCGMTWRDYTGNKSS